MNGISENSSYLLAAIGNIPERFLDECSEYVSQRSGSHRRRRVTRIVTLCAAAAAGAALLTGAAFTIFRVKFPGSFANRTEHSSAIYDIEPFRMSIELPAGYVIEPSENTEGGWSPMDIRLNGKTVGTADYNIFELYDGVDRSDPNFRRMVYNQLMLSAQGNWGNDYTVVKQDEVSENAVTKIGIVSGYGSGSPGEITYLPGILAYNTDLCVYVNISFENGVLTDEQLTDIAASIRLMR